MTKYERLLSEYDEKIKVFETEDMYSKGLYCDGIAWIKKNLTDNEKAAILAEEIGHHETTSGNILDQNNMDNIKQELIARGWAYNKLVPLDEIKEAYRKGYAQIYDMADYLGVDEPFLQDSVSYYESKYGDIWAEERHQSLIDAIMKLKRD